MPNVGLRVLVNPIGTHAICSSCNWHVEKGSCFYLHSCWILQSASDRANLLLLHFLVYLTLSKHCHWARLDKLKRSFALNVRACACVCMHLYKGKYCLRSEVVQVEIYFLLFIYFFFLISLSSSYDLDFETVEEEDKL